MALLDSLKYQIATRFDQDTSHQYHYEMRDFLHRLGLPARTEIDELIEALSCRYNQPKGSVLQIESWEYIDKTLKCITYNSNKLKP